MRVMGVASEEANLLGAVAGRRGLLTGITGDLIESVAVLLGRGQGQGTLRSDISMTDLIRLLAMLIGVVDTMEAGFGRLAPSRRPRRGRHPHGTARPAAAAAVAAAGHRVRRRPRLAQVPWDAIAAVVGGLLLVYAVLLLLLWAYARRHPETVSMKDALRLLPDLLRLLRRLLADRTLAAGLRIRLALLLAYLLSPIDLVPDFVPVIGYADDVIIVALVLRSVIRARRRGHPAEALAGNARRATADPPASRGWAPTAGTRRRQSVPAQQPESGGRARPGEHHHEERRPETQGDGGRGQRPQARIQRQRLTRGHGVHDRQRRQQADGHGPGDPGHPRIAEQAGGNQVAQQFPGVAPAGRTAAATATGSWRISRRVGARDGPGGARRRGPRPVPGPRRCGHG